MRKPSIRVGAIVTVFETSQNGVVVSAMPVGNVYYHYTVYWFVYGHTTGWFRSSELKVIVP